MKSDGHITEEIHDRKVFIRDTNYDGNEVEKPNAISQETRHHAKILSTNLQALPTKKNKTRQLSKQRKN